jgi:TolB-like protein/Flp pilus assembly protein TadD
LPDVFSKGVLLVVALGLPLAIILAWAYEMTPEGVKKEKDVDRSQSVTQRTGRKLDFAIIGVLSTIAVLPFVNMSSDEEQEYFSDGLTEELLNLLARMPELRVTSRSSAFYYKGKEIKIADVGRELGVGHILEGSVRRSGETIRITAQLIKVSDDTHVWSETWDRTFSDVFDIQDEIAQAVVDELKIRLVGGAPRANATDPEAYNLYLQAGYLLDHRSVSNLHRAEKLLKEALEIDSQFVDAWLSLGRAYWMSSGIGIRSPEETGPLAREAANKALQIDPGNAPAHLLLATVASSMDMDFATAKREIQQARLLAPNDSRVILAAAGLAYRTGDFDESDKLYAMAETVDPVGVSSWYGNGNRYLASRRYPQAEVAFRRVLALSPDGIGNHQRLATTLLLQGDFEGALEEANKEVVEGRRRSVRALIFQSMGDAEAATVEHEKLIELGERWTYEIAQMYAFRGMAEEAFEWLDRAIARSDSGFWFLVGDPFFDGIRDDPRFAIIEERLGIVRE